MGGETFHARDFMAGLPVQQRAEPRGDGSLHMVVAAGPYCLRDGLNYEPLERVLEYADRQRPDVLLLLGPFVDASNQRVVDGDPVLPGQDGPCPFEDIYTDYVLPLLVKRCAHLRRRGSPVEVLIVPSLEEALCFHPMPQPPLDASLNLEQTHRLDQLRNLGVTLLPNPAHISVAGLRMSITSADVLTPMLKEILLRGTGGKIEEALRQVLGQRTLFPVLPREPPQVSEARATALDFPEGIVPDMCIFPSQIGGLAGTFVDGTAFVNTGYVCRPAVMGQFTDVWIAPPNDGVLFQDRVRMDFTKLS